MNRGGTPRFIPIALFIIVVIIVIAVIVSIVRGFLGRDATELAVDPGEAALVNTSIDHSVRMTARGPIVAQEDARSYAIVVSPNSRSLVTYQGYLDTVLQNTQLSNNSNAYQQFVNALARANLMKGDELTGDANDTSGVCATGTLYEFSTLDANGAVKTLWTTTCSTDKGSLQAKLATVRSLFIVQIPEGNSLISEIGLR